MKINEEKLRTQWTNLEPIDLNNQTGVKNNDQIYILHHPEGNKEIQISTSNCQVISKYIHNIYISTYHVYKYMLAKQLVTYVRIYYVVSLYQQSVTIYIAL